MYKRQLYAGGFPGAGSWIHFAQWQSNSNPSYPAAGIGTPPSNFALSCSGYGVGTIFRVVMGCVNDYFRVRSGYTLCTTLGSYTGHEFSNDQGLTWVTPAYYHAHLGGSQHQWPLNNVAGDSRVYLSFWGGHIGGCCHNSYTSSAAWSQAYDIYVMG